MNGLALRINRGGGGKSKNSIAYSPVTIPEPIFSINEGKNILCTLYLFITMLGRNTYRSPQEMYFRFQWILLVKLRNLSIRHLQTTN